LHDYLPDGMDQHYAPRTITPESGQSQRPTSKMVQWIVEHSGGHVKNEKQANSILIGFVMLVLVVSLFFIFSDGTEVKKGGPGPSAQELEAYRKMQPF
jgi:hypothetical protein